MPLSFSQYFKTDPTGSTFNQNIPGTLFFGANEDGSPHFTAIQRAAANPGTSFSFVMHVQLMEASRAVTSGLAWTSGLSVANLAISRDQAETMTGAKLWVAPDLVANYVQSTAAPTPTVDNNVTPPSWQSKTFQQPPLWPSRLAVEAGPVNNNLGWTSHLLSCVGVDWTASGTTAASIGAKLRYSWVEF